MNTTNQSNDKVSVVVFDRKGGDYADLPDRFGWKHYHAYDTLRLSLENPVGILSNVWINIIAFLFCARTGLKAAWVTFANCLRLLLAYLNPNPGERLLWPDFGLCLEVLKMLPDTLLSSKAEYTRSLIQPLEGLVQCVPTFNAFQGLQVEDHIRRGESMVIAMPNINPPWVRLFMVDLIMAGVLYGRIARSERSDRINTIFVIDEADDDISELAENISGASFLASEVNNKGREFGIGAIYSVHSPCGISHFIRSNTTTHFFRCNDAADRLEAARTLMLPPNGELSLMSLDKGQCLVKQVGSWPYAVIGQVDYIPPSRVHITNYDRHSFIPSEPLAKLPHVQEELKKLIAQFRNQRAEQSRQEQAEKLDRYSISLMTLIAKYPFIPVYQLFELIGKIRHEVRLAICKKLVDHGLIVYEEKRLGRRSLGLVELTEKGRQFLKLKPDSGPQGRGSLAHRTTAHWI